MKYKGIEFVLFHNYYEDPPVVDPPPVVEETEEEEEELDPNKKSFTQDELNTILSKDRKKHEERNKKIAKQLEDLRKSKGLTEKEKSDLETHISQLKEESESKEKMLQKDLAKTKKQYEDQIKELEGKAQSWEGRYKKSILVTAVQGAAAKEKAYDAGQLIALVNTFDPEVVEELDKEGKPSGIFTPKVKYQDFDKDGNPVTLTLTVQEAVKRMKENTKSYGNLFEDTAKGGLGKDSGPSKDLGEIDFSKMTPEEYRKKYRQRVVG